MTYNIVIVLALLASVNSHAQGVLGKITNSINKNAPTQKNERAGKTGLSDADIISGLKDALRVATDSTVKTLHTTDGYFKNEPHNERVLHASILVNSIMKFPYQHKTNKLDYIKKIQEYLHNNKHFLES